jgi:radical SAM superfamily enzyme YgiQ (UPF0313 family)
VKILLVYPSLSDSFWSYKGVLKFTTKKAYLPPLGILTVAAMLPENWDLKLIDMNVGPLIDGEIEKADYIFLSAMTIQRESAAEVIKRCKKLGKKIVAGGPLFTADFDEFAEVDHIVLGEAESVIRNLIEDLENGCAKHLYRSEYFVELSESPVPRWSLIKVQDYLSLSMQSSRGCPFDCEFCDVVVLNGHKLRTKPPKQIISELEEIYRVGCRGDVFVVDDNFIGNKRIIKDDILPAMIEWSDEKKFHFWFATQVSINMADDVVLMDEMFKAGFYKVFVGIESVSQESLTECGKVNNKNRDMVTAVKTLQNHGFEVQGGFIVGFDSDPESIFEDQINFIQESGIVVAMVGLLGAPKGTKLYQRLKAENRLLTEWAGDNVSCDLNFIPKMDSQKLLKGYKTILRTVYNPRYYYQRINTLLQQYKLRSYPQDRRDSVSLMGALTTSVRNLKVIVFLGFLKSGRRSFWKLFISLLRKKRAALPIMMNLAVQSYYFKKFSRKLLKTN